MQEIILNSLEEMKATNVVILDVAPITSIADFMIIASGNSTRHVSSIAETVKLNLKQSAITQSITISGLENSEWVILDTGDILVHIMIPRVRELYALEELWDPHGTSSNST